MQRMVIGLLPYFVIWVETRIEIDLGLLPFRFN